MRTWQDIDQLVYDSRNHVEWLHEDLADSSESLRRILKDKQVTYDDLIRMVAVLILDKVLLKEMEGKWQNI